MTHRNESAALSPVLTFEALPSIVALHGTVLLMLSQLNTARFWVRSVATVEEAFVEAVLLQIVNQQVADRMKLLLMTGAAQLAHGDAIKCRREVLRHFKDCGASAYVH